MEDFELKKFIFDKLDSQISKFFSNFNNIELVYFNSKYILYKVEEGDKDATWEYGVMHIPLEVTYYFYCFNTKKPIGNWKSGQIYNVPRILFTSNDLILLQYNECITNTEFYNKKKNCVIAALNIDISKTNNCVKKIWSITVKDFGNNFEILNINNKSFAGVNLLI